MSPPRHRRKSSVSSTIGGESDAVGSAANGAGGTVAQHASGAELPPLEMGVREGRAGAEVKQRAECLDLQACSVQVYAPSPAAPDSLQMSRAGDKIAAPASAGEISEQTALLRAIDVKLGALIAIAQKTGRMPAL